MSSWNAYLPEWRRACYDKTTFSNTGLLAEYEERYRQGEVSEESYLNTRSYVEAIKDSYAQILPESDVLAYEEAKVSAGAVSGSSS